MQMQKQTDRTRTGEESDILVVFEEFSGCGENAYQMIRRSIHKSY